MNVNIFLNKIENLMKKILLVTKDIMTFRSLYPIAEFLKSQGYKVTIAAEGKSIKLWKESRYDLVYEGDEDPKYWKLRESEAEELIFRGSDGILIGLSNPINLESQIAHFAKRYHIPLGVICDTWGTINRLADKGEAPDYIFTLDSFDAGLCAAKFPDAHIAVIGDITRKITPPEDVSRVCDKIQRTGKNLILIAGQNPEYTDDVVRIIRDSVAMEPQNCAVVVRPHPKFKGLPEEKPILDLIKTFPEGIVVNIDGNTDDIASCARIVAGVFTTTLRVASMANRTAVSVVTPNTIEGMRKETGLSQYPLAMTGNCLEISKPTLLSKIPHHEGYKSKEFDPTVVMEMFK